MAEAAQMLGFGTDSRPGIGSWEQVSFYFQAFQKVLSIWDIVHCLCLMIAAFCTLCQSTCVYWTVAAESQGFDRMSSFLSVIGSVLSLWMGL